MTKYLLKLGIGYPTAIREDEVTIDELGYDQESWDALSENQKDDILCEEAKERLQEHIEYAYEELESDDDESDED